MIRGGRLRYTTLVVDECQYFCSRHGNKYLLRIVIDRGAFHQQLKTVRTALTVETGYPSRSGFNITTPSGGSVISSEHGWPCQGWGIAFRPGELVTPLPPYFQSSVFKSSL